MNMKTNVIMKSENDRELFGIVIRQETKNSMLSLTDLQEAYTHARVLNGWAEKGRITDIMAQKENVERIYYILSENSFIKSDFSDFMEVVKEKGLTKVLKELGVYKTTGRGENKQVMCNPYIWVLVAMELNPQIYAKVVTWLTDKLICNRIEACDLNNDLRRAISENIENPNYAWINKELNIKVFGYHEVGMRNLANQNDLKVLSTLQTNLAFCIEHGLIKNTEQIISEIKKTKIKK